MKNLIILDGQSHLAGRLASICAKELLKGKKIVILKSEKIEISGKHIRNKIKFLKKSKKRTNTNPKRGPFHFHSPSQIFWKIIRGMLPHKTKMGTSALMNLRVFEGIPKPFNMIKRFIVPSALRITRLAPGRKFSVLGELCNQIGWTKKHVIDSSVWHQNIHSRSFHKFKINSLKKRRVDIQGKIKYIYKNFLNGS